MIKDYCNLAKNSSEGTKKELVVRLEAWREKIWLWGNPRGDATVIQQTTNLEEFISNQIDHIKRRIDEYTNTRSDWVLRYVKGFRVEVYYYKPLRGGTYKPTPEDLASKKAVINVNNSKPKPLSELKKVAKELGVKFTTKTSKDELIELIKEKDPDYSLEDNKCFLWSVLACLHPVTDHTDRLPKYKPYENVGVVWPMKVDNIQKFANADKLIINVYEWTDELKVLHTDRQVYREQLPIVNLILYEGHYMWMKSMSALIYQQTNNTNKLHTCLRCLHHFTCKRTLQEHIPKCLKLHDGECTVNMPPEGSYIKFKNIMKMEKALYTVYSDFELVIDKETNKHIPCGFARALVNSASEMLRFNLHRGEDCMEKFFKDLQEIKDMVDNIPIAPMKITDQ